MGTICAYGNESMAKETALPAILLFDLGGVLVRWVGLEEIARISRSLDDPEVVRDRWLESSWVRRFEVGRCTREEFCAGVIEEFELAMSGAEFAKVFPDWVSEPLPGALELLDELAPRFSLACLSNTNVFHGERMRVDFGLGARLDHTYFSYEIGHVKPDVASYRHVVEGLGCDPHDILFFDDTPKCVDGARDCGLRARVARGVCGVKEALAREGIEV